MYYLTFTMMSFNDSTQEPYPFTDHKMVDIKIGVYSYQGSERMSYCELMHIQYSYILLKVCNVLYATDKRFKIIFLIFREYQSLESTPLSLSLSLSLSLKWSLWTKGQKVELHIITIKYTLFTINNYHNCLCTKYLTQSDCFLTQVQEITHQGKDEQELLVKSQIHMNNIKIGRHHILYT